MAQVTLLTGCQCRCKGNSIASEPWPLGNDVFLPRKKRETMALGPPWDLAGPLKIDPIYTLCGWYLLGKSPFKGLPFWGGSTAGCHPKGRWRCSPFLMTLGKMGLAIWHGSLFCLKNRICWCEFVRGINGLINYCKMSVINSWNSQKTVQETPKVLTGDDFPGSQVGTSPFPLELTGMVYTSEYSYSVSFFWSSKTANKSLQASKLPVVAAYRRIMYIDGSAL